MFTPQGEMPTVTDNPAVPEFLTTANQDRNPLVPLPDVDLTYDAVVVTHRHPNHWNEAAREELDADVPLFCQPEEAEVFTDEGFTDVRPVDDETTLRVSLSTERRASTGTANSPRGWGPSETVVVS